MEQRTLLYDERFLAKAVSVSYTKYLSCYSRTDH